MRAAALLAAALVLAGCTVSPKPPQSAQSPTSACSTTPVILQETTPLFTGPGPTAALDRALSKGQSLLLCGAQGQRQQVLLPRPGRTCRGPADCTAGWIPTSAKLAPAR
jgi:hypothetical protein